MRYVLGLATFYVLGIVSTAALGDEKNDCINAAESGQRLRSAGKLMEARAEFAICARPTCPAIVQGDCVKWATGVAANIPSIAVRARDERGADIPGARVVVDGVERATQLDGKPIELDPGAHTVTLERPGSVSVSTSVVSVTGEQNRLVTVELPSAVTSAEQRPLGPARSVPRLAYVLGGVGLAGLATFGVFAALGESQFQSDLNSCAHSGATGCSNSEVQSVRTKMLAADISLGAGILSLAAATYVFLSRPNVKAGLPQVGPNPGLDMGVVSGGGAVRLGLSF
jgi:hypothetical protein